MQKNSELFLTDKSNTSQGSELSKVLRTSGQCINGLVGQVSLPNIKSTIMHLTSYSTRFTFSDEAVLAGGGYMSNSSLWDILMWRIKISLSAIPCREI